MSGPQLSDPSSGSRSSFRCDFCGAEVESVRRIALDSGYDRLRVPHQERFACAECSERKERHRLGLR